MLQTSAFRLPAETLGDLWVYPLPAGVMDALSDLGKRWRGRNDRARAPHASLANALSATTGRPVLILPRTRRRDGDVLLVTTEPIDPGILGIAVREWERLCRGSDTNVLAPLLAGVAPLRTSLGDAVARPAAGRVAPEPWIFRVLHWVVARRLAARPVAFDGREVPFRLDSAGSLVAWDDPVTRPRRGREDARALMRVTPHIKTVPGVGDLVCVLDASLTRLHDRLYDVRKVWIDHGRDHGGGALLRLPVGYRKGPDGGWSVLGDFSADIVTACGLDALPWGPDVLREHPDRVRAGRATSAEHPIGSGVGPRTYLRLVEHAAELLNAEPLTYRPFTGPGKSARRMEVRVRASADGSRLGADALDAAIGAAGHGRLRIVTLTGTPEMRRRLRGELEKYRHAEVPGLTPELGVAQRLTRRAEVVGYDVAALLRDDRPDAPDLLSQAPMLKAEPGTLVLALVETIYPADEDEDVPDAKRPLRRALAGLGVASQFVAARPAADERDHPAEAALKDLMRVGGFSDGRLRDATVMQPYALDRPVRLVGVHVRRQNAAAAKARPTLVASLVAVHADPDPSRPWDMHMYVPGRGWRPHAEGVAAFHAGPIGAEISREQASFEELRDLVDQALDTLPRLDEDPVVVMIDADASRRVWSGLSNPGLGAGTLPGDGLPDAGGITVVRVCADDHEIPRPVHRAAGGRRPADPGQPAKPDGRIYVHEGDDGTRSWLLGRTSKTYESGADGRCGAAYTRFTLPPEKKALQGKPWHSFTGTEFVVARAGRLPEEAAVSLAARLCAQPVSWDGRTRWPVPLHMARIADEDHPSYRSEADHPGTG